MEILKNAIESGRPALSEFESKQLLAAYNISITKEILIQDISQLESAVKAVGYPLVMKGCSSEIAHKTEKGLIHIDLRNWDEACAAFEDLSNKMDGTDKAILVQEMIKGQRDLVVGMTRDPQYGVCVMFGLGGIFTEVYKDVSFRIAPLTLLDALDLMDDIKGKIILDGIRGMKAVDRKVLADILVAVGQIGIDHDEIQEIDINPLKIMKGRPIAVDALIALKRK